MKANVESSISSKEYARFFIEKSASVEDIIPEVFRLFSVNCIDFCNIDPHELDNLISDFYANKSNRLQILTRIIDLRRFAGQTDGCDKNTLYGMILEYVEKNFLSDFLIRDMAETLNISYYYMCHLFKEVKGCSVNSYKNTLRLQRAERLLALSDKAVTDIAFECGFDSPGYFTEKFTKYCGCSPSEFRSRIKGTRTYYPYYTDKDICLINRMKTINFLDNVQEIRNSDAISTYEICTPDDEYKFMHGAAVIEFEGVLYASWYNCPERDLVSHTPVRGKRSADGGKTWSAVETIDEDPDGITLYSPSAYGIDGGKLYMFVNEMTAPDCIHALSLYVLDRKTDKFVKLWSKKTGFKLNTNAMRLPNRKLMLSGRAGERDRLPLVPAVMISDGVNIDGDWRVVKIAPDKYLPDGESYVYPETCPIIKEDKIYMFCRNDRRNVPIVYISEDKGESWSEPFAHDIPLDSSKMYCGSLLDGRNYIVGNIENRDRTKLVLYISDDEKLKFTKCYIISDAAGGYENSRHYPSAYESNGKLYITYSSNVKWFTRGIDLTVVDLEKL